MRKRHYQILLAATLGCFLLLLATEVAGRYSETISQYEEMGEREALVASPESLVVRRVALKAREDTLKRGTRPGSGGVRTHVRGVPLACEQSSTGDKSHAHWRGPYGEQRQDALP